MRARENQLVKIGDLVGRAEMARRLGVKVHTPDKWRERYPDFPAPLPVEGRLWWFPEVEMWAKVSKKQQLHDASIERERPQGTEATAS